MRDEAKQLELTQSYATMTTLDESAYVKESKQICANLQLILNSLRWKAAFENNYKSDYLPIHVNF
jgi:hypothetical protein